jgi:hypothetical protein
VTEPLPDRMAGDIALGPLPATPREFLVLVRRYTAALRAIDALDPATATRAQARAALREFITAEAELRAALSMFLGRVD